jgi:ABC-type transport system substrate-binding protein
LLPPSLGGGNGAVWAGVEEQVRLSEARRLLAEAGWSADRPLRLVLLLPPGRDHVGVAERVAADWARIGVFMAITEVDAASHDRIVARGDYDLAVSEATVPVPDAAALLARYRCGAGPHCNPEADALLDAARSSGPDARPLLLGRAEAALMAAPPMIPLFTPVRWALVARNVEGWVPNRAASHPVARLAVTGKRR